MTACTKVGWWEEEVGWRGREWQIWATRTDWGIEGGELVHSAERHSLVCFQTLMRFWQEKRSTPPLSCCHSSDAGPPLGSRSGLQQPSHYHVTVFKANLNMALMVIFFSLFLRKFNEVGPLMADELSFYCLFNIQNQTLIFLDLVYWQINALVFLGQWGIFSSSQGRKKKELRKYGLHYITLFGLRLQNQRFLCFCNRTATGKETAI